MTATPLHRHRGPTFFVLAAVVAGTWTVVAYQTTVHLGGGRASSVAIGTYDAPVAPAPKRTDGDRYRADFRDPFALSPSARRPTETPRMAEAAPDEAPAANEAPSRVREPPPLVFQGVVDRTALLQDGEAVYFVGRGDTLAGARIADVRPDAVDAHYDDTVFTLRLARWAPGGFPPPIPPKP